MLKKVKDILAEITAEELELKRGTGYDFSLIEKTISAFANHKGGYILFGVDDNSNIIGLSDRSLHDISKRIELILKSMTAVCETFLDEIENKTVLVLYVHRNEQNYAVRASDGKAYQRIHDRNIPITKDANQLLENDNDPIMCFVAMSFREQEYPRLVDFYDAMQRAAKRCSYHLKVEKNDDKPFNGDVVERIHQKIKNSQFVLADYTLNSSNVYYEEGYAKGLGLEVIQTCENTTDLAFDINHNNTYTYANAHQLEEQLVESFNDVCGRIIAKLK